MNDHDNQANDDASNSHRIKLLEQLIRRYAWCRVPSIWGTWEGIDYLLVIELPDGRRYWRHLSNPFYTPDEFILGWATCPPRKWYQTFRKGGNLKRWNEYFDFWAKPRR